MITSYKNREIDYNKPVEFYRCLNRKGFVFSIRQNSLVVGHSNNIILKDCSLVVNESGKKRCLKDKERNVHAYIKGMIGSFNDIKSSFSFNLSYNPYLERGFHTSNGDLDKCEVVYISQNKILCQL